MLSNKFKKILVIMLTFLLVGCSSNATNNKNEYKNEWAFYNYGQSIEKKVGTKGIDINILPAWEITQGNSDVIVGVIDTGVDLLCKSLKNSFYNNPSELIDGIDNDNNGFIDDNISWNFFDNSNNLFDDYLYDYHGTYICTTIHKVAPEVKILPVKFMKGSSGSIENAIKAIKYSISCGAKIINCSWNFQEFNDDMYELFVNNPDILFICAAGNSNINLDKNKLYPCSYDLDNIITVLAIDNQGEICETSGYGINTDIAAPGWNISAILPENDVSFISGTSVATAFVSAAAALIYSVNDNLSPKEIKDCLIKSAQPLNSLNKHCSSGGYLDISAALDLSKQK